MIFCMVCSERRGKLFATAILDTVFLTFLYLGVIQFIFHICVPHDPVSDNPLVHALILPSVYLCVTQADYCLPLLRTLFIRLSLTS